MDWLKVQKSTPDKPEIAILARKLGVSIGEAFLSWFRVYCWADGISHDGCVPFLSLCDGDTLSHAIPGTCDALASEEIGWLEDMAEGGIRFVHWDRHNGKSAKQRALDAEKKRQQRSLSRKCPDDNGTKAEHGGGQKRDQRREEKNKNPLPPLPADLQTPEFEAAWQDWLTFRAEKKVPLTPTTAKMQFAKFATWGIARSIEVIQHTIAMGWQGLREPEASGRPAQLPLPTIEYLPAVPYKRRNGEQQAQ